MEWVLDRNEVFMAHILAIDDDPGILALIEHALRREGHTITCMPHVPAILRRTSQSMISSFSTS